MAFNIYLSAGFTITIEISYYIIIKINSSKNIRGECLNLKEQINSYISFLKNEKNYSHNTIISYRDDLIQLLNYFKDYKILERNNLQYIDRSIMRKYIVYYFSLLFYYLLDNLTIVINHFYRK